MRTAQVFPSFTHDLYFALPHTWDDGCEPEVQLLRYGEFQSRGGFTWDNPPEDSYRIHWIEEGQGTISINGESAHILAPGAVFVMQPRRSYYRQEISSNRWRYRWAWLRGVRVGQLLQATHLEPDYIHVLPDQVHRLDAFFQHCRRVLGGEQVSLAASCQLGWDLFYALERSDTYKVEPNNLRHAPIPRDKIVAMADNRAGHAIEWLHQHYAKGVTVEDAAKALGISRATLYRAFRGHTGQSPKEFLNYLRLEHACHLLQEKRYTIKEIAARSGYSNPHHFTRAFSQQKGVSPLRWINS